MSALRRPPGDHRPAPPDAALAGPAGPVPSIRSRLANALAVWSLVWSLAVGAAAWLAASHEVDELMDDALRASADLLAHQLQSGPAPNPSAGTPARPAATEPGASDSTVVGQPPVPQARLAWQLVAADGRLLQRSAAAPAAPWHATATAGRSDVTGWHLHGTSLGSDGRMLYIAQSHDERVEAGSEVAVGALVAALAVGLLGHVWLRARVRAELKPLQTLSDRLVAWDVGSPEGESHHPLGAAERRELQPVHQAIETLTARLALRIANERAFSAQAAHALRTPLAGIDAQLAVALRDCPPALRERLQRVRGATDRLQAVVNALLGLFRSGAALDRRPVALAPLLARLPSPTLQVQCDPEVQVVADADLLAAALVNLLDNAQRHGAHTLWVELPVPGANRLRLRDDGPGVAEARREALQSALDRQDYDDAAGLGLVLADRVARAHGGQVWLPAVDRGFVVELDLGPAKPVGKAQTAAPTSTPTTTAPLAPPSLP